MQSHPLQVVYKYVQLNNSSKQINTTRSRPQILIENVQEPLGALEVGQERELLTDATHLHLLFPGLAIFCLFVEDAVSIF